MDTVPSLRLAGAGRQATLPPLIAHQNCPDFLVYCIENKTDFGIARVSKSLTTTPKPAIDSVILFRTVPSPLSPPPDLRRDRPDDCVKDQYVLTFPPKSDGVEKCRSCNILPHLFDRH